jgi:hypothetical protein
MVSGNGGFALGLSSAIVSLLDSLLSYIRI